MKNRRTIFHVVFILAIALFLWRCSEDEPTGPSRDDFRYPLKTGNTWEYSRTVSLTYNPTSGVRPSDSTFTTVRVQVIGEEIIFDSLTVIKVREEVTENNASTTNYNYYQNKSDALYLVGTFGVPVALPKRSLDVSPIQDIVFSHPWDLIAFLEKNNTIKSADSIYFEKPAKSALKYPLKAGAEWMYSEKNKPRRINKRVIGETEVSTEAGTFAAVKVQWKMDFNGDGEFDDNVQFFDYIANAGLVKRSFRIKNLPMLDDGGGNIGSYDYHDMSVLTSYTLK